MHFPVLCTAWTLLGICFQVLASHQQPIYASHNQVVSPSQQKACLSSTHCAYLLAQELASKQAASEEFEEICGAFVAALSELESAAFACEVGQSLFDEESGSWTGTSSLTYTEKSSVNW